MEYLETVRKCKRCNAYFKERDNIGSWKCSYHPGLLDYTEDIAKYRCCGTKKNQPYLSSESYMMTQYGSIPLCDKKRTVSLDSASMVTVRSEKVDHPVLRICSSVSSPIRMKDKLPLRNRNNNKPMNGCVLSDHIFDGMEQFTCHGFLDLLERCDDNIIKNVVNELELRPGWSTDRIRRTSL